MREYFCAYHSMLGAMRKLSDAECGRLFRALLKYSSGEEQINLQGREELLFDVFCQQIDRDAQSYEKKCAKNRENVMTRYPSSTTVDERIPSPTTVDERIQPCTTAYQTYQDKDKDKDKDKDEYEYERDTGGGGGTHAPACTPARPREGAVPRQVESADTDFGAVLVDHGWQRVVANFHRNIGSLPMGRKLDELQALYDKLGEAVTIYAIELTNDKHPNNPVVYLTHILQGWEERNVRTLDEAKALVKSHESTARAAKPSAPGYRNPFADMLHTAGGDNHDP